MQRVRLPVSGGQRAATCSIRADIKALGEHLGRRIRADRAEGTKGNDKLDRFIKKEQQTGNTQ
jgi:hypothetical protein